MPDHMEPSQNSAQHAWARHEIVVPGVISGVFGGTVMALVVAVCASSAGMSPLHPLMAIGATFGGAEVLVTGGGTVAYSTGAALHIATSALLGLLFAALLPRGFSLVSAMAVGAGYALFAMGVMMSLIVPAVNPVFRIEMQPIGGSWVIAHALFGAALGLAPALRRRLARDPNDRANAIARRGAADIRPVPRPS